MPPLLTGVRLSDLTKWVYRSFTGLMHSSVSFFTLLTARLTA